ncbi:MAG: sodium/proton antiporter NhaB [Gammaproteobacteria bacterium]|jgi:NhaB family Na+:H+ antiporter|nr:sodium/proton antiporter NhaB [Gammaproteobacteria bacterium]MBT5334647.1 sodium/proton antiporter NhaB [Gammaproteobacteria bacterium]MBT5682341.1 sodium/proton antiporter NhaB [Gammaproteobacteria bacterium]MBT6025960.1 sodium/proton antiporter NhaB [Gammaproteobacteria bacterium]MBT6558421.1 sodium/proton antiporter NhaB [Gammaproteobacteria bacterium]
MKGLSLSSFSQNFLGNAPEWYKLTIIGFLIFNPLLLLLTGNAYLTGWVLVLEFIFTLAMALKCYPLQPGGLLAIEAVVMGMTSPATVYHEVELALPVILLLVFMVAGIYFMKDLLLFTFTKILLSIRSKTLIAFLFCAISAFLSAFLDALTVTAVVISVGVGFYSIYHKVAAGKLAPEDRVDGEEDGDVPLEYRAELNEFRAFLRNLLMHAAVGTALGGVCTTVGEPQNLLIASQAGWNFAEFFWRMAPVTMPVLAAGLLTCILLEQVKILGYGAILPERVRTILTEFDEAESARRSDSDKAKLVIQAISGLILIWALANHVAEVGLIGLTIIVLQTAFNGVIEEHQLGHAFEEALPFTALLVVFFGIVGVIHDQHLFSPIIAYVLSLPLDVQPGMFYIANGVLSAISDNVFVATVYIGEVKAALDSGAISREQFDLLAVAINTGTNIPSVATPNGQAAFLFLLTSSIAPLIGLSYMRMVTMALPYTIVMGVTGWAGVNYLL